MKKTLLFLLLLNTSAKAHFWQSNEVKLNLREIVFFFEGRIVWNCLDSASRGLEKLKGFKVALKRNRGAAPNFSKDLNNVIDF